MAGRFTLSAADAGPLMQLLAAPGPDVLSRLPVEARAEVSTAEGRWTFADLSGTVAAQPFAGRLAVDLEKDTLDGALTLDRISAATVLGLALGPTQPPIAGAVWSSSRFASVLPPPFATTIAVRGKVLDLGDAGVAADPSFTMRWTAENLELAKLDGGYRGGRLGGGLDDPPAGGGARQSGRKADADGRVASRAVPRCPGGRDGRRRVRRRGGGRDRVGAGRLARGRRPPSDPLDGDPEARSPGAARHGAGARRRLQLSGRAARRGSPEGRAGALQG